MMLHGYIGVLKNSRNPALTRVTAISGAKAWISRGGTKTSPVRPSSDTRSMMIVPTLTSFIDWLPQFHCDHEQHAESIAVTRTYRAIQLACLAHTDHDWPIRSSD